MARAVRRQSDPPAPPPSPFAAACGVGEPDAAGTAELAGRLAAGCRDRAWRAYLRAVARGDRAKREGR